MNVTKFNNDLATAINKALQEEKNKSYITNTEKQKYFVLKVSYWGFAEVKETPYFLTILISNILIKSLGFRTRTAFFTAFFGEKYARMRKPPKELYLFLDEKKNFYLHPKNYNDEKI